MCSYYRHTLQHHLTEWTFSTLPSLGPTTQYCWLPLCVPHSVPLLLTSMLWPSQGYVLDHPFLFYKLLQYTVSVLGAPSPVLQAWPSFIHCYWISSRYLVLNKFQKPISSPLLQALPVVYHHFLLPHHLPASPLCNPFISKSRRSLKRHHLKFNYFFPSLESPKSKSLQRFLQASMAISSALLLSNLFFTKTCGLLFPFPRWGSEPTVGMDAL